MVEVAVRFDGDRLMFKAILFDNDGILVDTERFYFEANRQILGELAPTIDFSRETYRRVFLETNLGLASILRSAGYDDPSFIRQQQEARNARYSALLSDHEVVIEGVEEVLAALAERYAIGIVTSALRHHFDAIHRRSGLLRYVRFVVAHGDYAESKPSPHPYLVGAERSGWAPEACLAVEDSRRGLLAAKAAGCTCWVVPNDLTRGSDFSLADRILNTVADLRTLL
ncbi:MAG: HAD family phosphatase [Deltaproteobacteria bacterium]|nr:HAD family phosphatase [Deltaproteobacteria bacterium]